MLELVIIPLREIVIDTNARLVIIVALLQIVQVPEMEHAQQVITALLAQQVQLKMLAELGNTALLEALVQLIALLDIMGAQLQIQ